MIVSHRRQLAWILAAAVISAWAPGSHAQDVAPHAVPFQVFELDNGLTVILSEDHSAPTYSIAVAYNVGSRNEERGQTGFAHLIEHLMFQGSENVGRGEHFSIVQQNGGGVDSETTADHTIYYQTLPANQLDLGLFLEADRMRSLEISESSFETQRTVVADERLARHETAPYGLTEETILGAAHDSFAYGHPTIGPMDDLNRATVDEVREFHRRHYAPNNAVIALVGDIDPDNALAKVEQYFGNIPSQPELPALNINERPQAEERRVTVRDAFAQLPRLDVVFRAPPGSSPQWYMMAVLADVLALDTVGRLYERLVLQDRLALDVAAAIDERRGNSLFRISAILADGVDPANVEAVIYAEVERLKTEPVDGQELGSVRAQMERAESERLQSTLSRATVLAANAVFYEDPGLINRNLSSLESVTAEAIMSSADIYLRESNRTVVMTLPEASGTVLGGRRP
jgi:zinc protease